MESQNFFLELLKERPDFILLILLVLIIPFMFLVLIPIAFILRRLNTPRTQLVKEMLRVRPDTLGRITKFSKHEPN